MPEEAFRKISGVRVKWLSLEPLLAPLKFNDLSMFDFVVIGSQSQTTQPKEIAPEGVVPAFAPRFEWVARLWAQALECGCRIYLKPNLQGVPNPQCAGMALPQEEPRLRAIGEQPSAPPTAPADDPTSIPPRARARCGQRRQRGRPGGRRGRNEALGGAIMLDTVKPIYIKLADIIVPPNRMRRLRLEKVDEFAESMAARGDLVHPIVVRPRGEMFELVVGRLAKRSAPGFASNRLPAKSANADSARSSAHGQLKNTA
jgi:hypothetical protein